MAPRRKQGEKMKYRGFYCGDKLYAELQRCAEILDETDSEYIRKAVEQRNAQYKGCTTIDKEAAEVLAYSMAEQYTGNHKPSGIGSDIQGAKYVSDNKPTYFKPCPKGGKK